MQKKRAALLHHLCDKMLSTFVETGSQQGPFKLSCSSRILLLLGKLEEKEKGLQVLL